MNPDEYNRIAKDLQKQLDQSKSLIRFHVPDFSEYASEYLVSPIDSRDKFVIAWSLKIADKELTGRLVIDKDIIGFANFDLTKYIVGTISSEIAHAITHPNEIPKAAWVVI